MVSYCNSLLEGPARLVVIGRAFLQTCFLGGGKKSFIPTNLKCELKVKREMDSRVVHINPSLSGPVFFAHAPL